MLLKCVSKLYLCIHTYLHQGLTHASDHIVTDVLPIAVVFIHVIGSCTLIHSININTDWYIFNKSTTVFHQEYFSVIVVT